MYSRNNSAGQTREENNFKANRFSQQAKKQALRLELRSNLSITKSREEISAGLYRIARCIASTRMPVIVVRQGLTSLIESA